MIKVISLGSCPNGIMLSRHHRDDGTCKCDDINDDEMAEWGYTWDLGQWRNK